MAEKKDEITAIPIGEVAVGQVYDLGTEILDEKAIVEFASRFDPLPFHTDPKYAESHIFGILVASGPHLFIEVYRKHWVPRFGHSVVAGLAIDNWKFLAPVVVDAPNHIQIEVKAIQPNPEKQVMAITWHFVLSNETGNPTQHLDMTVLHRMD